MSGKLVLIVGPSGVGKDTLLDMAKEYLAEDDQFIFPRRYITRPEGAGGEDHKAITEENFELKKKNKAFALSWEAHGLKYGIPISTLRDVANGNTVIVNVSRSILQTARDLFPAVQVACITAHPEILRQRLLQRGRENSLEIEKRIERAAAYALKDPDILSIDNSGPLDVAVQSFIRLISEPLRASA